MRKHLKGGKGHDQHRNLELNPPENSMRMKNYELEAPHNLHDNHRIRTLKERMKKLHIDKMDN